jgi:hypothetical protein
MQAKHFVLLVCILLLSVGCSTSSDFKDPQSSVNTQDTPHETLSVMPSATIKAPFTPEKIATTTSTPVLKTPPPTPNPSYSLQVQSMESPNGEWVAQATFEQEIGKQYHIQFTVSRKDETKVWTILDYWGDGEGYTYAQLHRWSNDGQYFYFTGDRIAGGGCDFSPIDSKWQRLNIDTGKITDFTLPAGRGHAASPDESTIAYASPDIPLYVSLDNVQSGQEQKVFLPTDSAQIGDILWTPDGKAIILSVVNGDLCGSSRPTFSLIRVDINSLKITELASNSQDLLRPIQVELPNYLLIKDWNGYTWWIDATSGKPTTAP